MSVRVITGDVRQVLATMPERSVNMCITSPPYHGLRSYLPADHPEKHLEIGSEASVDDWVRTMVDVFAGVRRVLRNDGTLWLNLGDSYAGSRRGGSDWPGSTLNGKQTDHSRVAKHQVFTEEQRKVSLDARRAMTASRRRDDHLIPRTDLRQIGFKPKDMHGQPWRAAFALQGFAVISCKTLGEWADLLQAARAAQDWSMVELVENRIRSWDFSQALKADGWYLRQEIIWAKNNPMPESAKDRCTKSHEHIFLLSKSAKYYYDADAIAEPVSEGTHARMSQDVASQAGSARANGGVEPQRPMKAGGRVPVGWDTSTGDGGSHRKGVGRYSNNGVGFGHGYDEKVKPRATGSPKTVPAYEDGKSGRLGREPGWRVARNERYAPHLIEQPETRNKRSVWSFPTQGFKGSHYATFPEALVEPCILAGCPVGGTVLDCFGGSGTTGLVADRHHRNAILIDLDERNAPMATKRISTEAKLFAEITS